jgi:hypothetical protein
MYRTYYVSTVNASCTLDQYVMMITETLLVVKHNGGRTGSSLGRLSDILPIADE